MKSTSPTVGTKTTAKNKKNSQMWAPEGGAALGSGDEARGETGGTQGQATDGAQGYGAYPENADDKED